MKLVPAAEEDRALPPTTKLQKVYLWFLAMPLAMPFLLDTTAPRQRSYVSTDGITFRLVESTNIGSGNFGIRARIDSATSTVTSIPSMPIGDASSSGRQPPLCGGELIKGVKHGA